MVDFAQYPWKVGKRVYDYYKMMPFIFSRLKKQFSIGTGAPVVVSLGLFFE